MKMRNKKNAWFLSLQMETLLCAVLLFAAALQSGGCAGGLPSIPNSPEDIMAKGDHYFSRGKYFQAKELYRAFMAKYPGHDWSDKAQFFLAESEFNDKQYPLAAVEYRVLVSNYGYSEYVDDAFFKTAMCALRQSPKSVLDQSKSFEALSLFDQFIRTFPNSSLIEEANTHIGDIHKKLAEKDFDNAMFYYHQKNFKSTAIYLDKIITNYPGNVFWLKSLYYHGTILLKTGDKEEARKEFERVIKYPGDLPVKKQAEEALKSIGAE